MTYPEQDSGNTVSQTIDLTDCDREPIHIPGLIQPHGVLLALAEPELKIVRASHNTDVLFGKTTAQMLGSRLGDVLEPEMFAAVQRYCAHADAGLPKHLFTAEVGTLQNRFDVIVHRRDDLVIIEFELAVHQSAADTSFLTSYAAVRDAISELQNAGSISELCARCAQAVQRLTNFDRVMIYRFLPDESGEVVAEARRETIEPFLGLRYPASDIPQQARQLYLLNRLRLIPDVSYQPVGLSALEEPAAEKSTSPKPLDMSFSVLRSVSPIHIQYLKNMGVSASMSISLVREQKLWGLIACHHYSPKYVSFDGRAGCELLGQTFSLQIAAQEDREASEYRHGLNQTLNRFIEFMSRESEFTDGLIKHHPNLLDFVAASGAALFVNNTCTLLGATPSEREVRGLVGWLGETNSDDVFATDSLPAAYAPATAFKDLASGLLAVPIARKTNDYILWFRPETLQVVNWSGDPHKPVEASAGVNRLSPRRSFELWQETVRLKSVPWQPAEINAARNLRRVITEIIIGKAEELSRLNRELALSNEELDAFTYIASHDLKEPLRGIHNFSEFLMSDHAASLDADGRAKLETVMSLARRMELMIDSLMQFARVGRLELTRETVDLNRIVGEVLDILKPVFEERRITVEIPRPLPFIEAEAVRVEQVYLNLLTNAAKYTEKPDKRIEIGFINPAASEPKPKSAAAMMGERDERIILFVRDNGIGIQEKHYQNVFKLFRRLHGRDQYGGGSGAGLTIVKKIVERHQGRVWLDSVYGESATFYFLLEA